MITAADIAEALAELGVERGDTLFVHSGLQGATRVEGDRPADKLETVITGLGDAVPEGVLAMPTFTYSFTKDEVFDPVATPSTVGALTERFRALEDARRTLEPNFSCALRGAVGEGWERMFAPGNTDAFGDDGIFGYLRERNAKLLFIGVGFEFCTYVHHVEQRLAVPYRYVKEFPGIVRHDGAEWEVIARYLVRSLDGDVVPHFKPLAAELVRRGLARVQSLPRGPRLFVTDASAVEEVARECVAAQPDFLLRRGHERPAHADAAERTIMPGS